MFSRMRQSPHRPALAVPCLLASASLLGGLLCAETASAAATECPRVGSEYRCVLVDAGSEIAVRVGEQGGGTLELDRWRVAGREQLFFEGFSLRDFTGPDPQEVIVTAALVDPEANDIFVELVSGTLRLSVAFSLQHGATSVVDETIHVTSDLESVSTRLYVVHDFDLDGDAIDGLVFADPSGREIVQTDGPVSARVAWIDGSPPDGFDVARCCELESLVVANATFLLTGRTAVPGPDDFQSALQWDHVLGPGESFSVTLQKTVDVPEPNGWASGVVAGAALGLLATRQR